MNKLIASFPKHIDEAMNINLSIQTGATYDTIKNIVICGMGGSGIGGEIVASWIQGKLKIPILCCHDYTPPSFIDQNTLLIACSYSGDTEETLHFMQESIERKATIIGICSGGEMENICLKNKMDYVKIPNGFPPRAALAFSIIQIVRIITECNFIDSSILNSIHLGNRLLKEKQIEIQDIAKQLAEFIQNSIPIFYATSSYHAILTRARQQFNENSKILCWSQTLPEMNHNELVGWSGGDKRFSAIFFNTNDLSQSNKTRLNFTQKTISEKTKTLTITVQGINLIERSLYMIHLVDWASWYLADLTKVDSMEVNLIGQLKNELK